MTRALANTEEVDFYLEVGKLSSSDTDFLSKSFNNLCKNSYKDGEFRLRRFSHFNYKNDQLTHLPKKAFVQPAEFNTFEGDVERRYDEIENNVIKSPAFIEMFRLFKLKANVSDDANIDTHQIRIRCVAGEQSSVTPEGVHQDGYEQVAMYFIQRENIKDGGELCVHTTKENEPFIKHAFDNGEFVFVNDQLLWHSATDLVAEQNNNATMDVFVLLAK